MGQKRKYNSLCTAPVATKSEAALASEMQLLTKVTYVELSVTWYPSIWNFHATDKNSKENVPFL
jgi:hypothetical protein